ncbi:MAG: hypothetical protein ACRYGM_05270 [Janthinobacterium lividum]
MADVVDGTYSYVDGVVTAFSSSSMSQVENFLSVATRLQNGDIAPKQALRKISKESPKLSGVLKKALNLNTLTVVITAAGLFLQYLQFKSSEHSPSDVLHALGEIKQTLQKDIDSRSTPTSAGMSTPQQYSLGSQQSSQPGTLTNKGWNRKQRRAQAAQTRGQKR